MWAEIEAMSETHRNSEGAPEPGVYPYTTGDGTGVDPTVPLPPKPEHAPAAYYGEAPIEGTVLPGDRRERSPLVDREVAGLDGMNFGRH